MRATGSTKPTSGRSPTPHRPTRASKDAPDGPTPPQGHPTAIRVGEDTFRAHGSRISRSDAGRRTIAATSRK